MTRMSRWTRSPMSPSPTRTERPATPATKAPLCGGFSFSASRFRHNLRSRSETAIFPLAPRRDTPYTTPHAGGARRSPDLRWGHSSVGRALEWHSRGQGFDSPWLHQFFLHRVESLSPGQLCPGGCESIPAAFPGPSGTVPAAAGAQAAAVQAGDVVQGCAGGVAAAADGPVDAKAQQHRQRDQQPQRVDPGIEPGQGCKQPLGRGKQFRAVECRPCPRIREGDSGKFRFGEK